MNIIHQASKAKNQNLRFWFQNIQQGQIKLPRFQRNETWDRHRVTSFLDTIISNLPVGVILALEVGETEKFVSRFIETAPQTSQNKVTKHLLDGQQRLTAFWRAVHNNYENETYFIHIPYFDTTSDNTDHKNKVSVRCTPRSLNKKEIRMPLWAEQPDQCLKRGLFPVDLLRPEDITDNIEGWVEDATRRLKPSQSDSDSFSKLEKFNSFMSELKNQIQALRETVKYFNLPYLWLPSETDKEVAIQVFINMNTNNKPLSIFDIIVAEVENVNDVSLHEREDTLRDNCPHLDRYGEVRGLILSTSCLLQEKLPNQRGMLELNMKELIANWGKLDRGFNKMTAFLESQGIFDRARLPTNAVLAVIAASYEFIPNAGDFLGKAETLLQRYLWSSFFTDRYENTTASRAFYDFKAIKALLKNQQFSDDEINSVPVLNCDKFPLVKADSLLSVGWPKGPGIQARGILAVANYFGALDFADNNKATYASIQNREYHHIFPKALLSEAGIESSLALNCALITCKTNRTIGRKDPLDYLKDRTKWADDNVVGERLKSHLISYDHLSKASFSSLDGEALKKQLSKSFDAFKEDRAKLVVTAIDLLANGKSPSLEIIWSENTVATKGQESGPKK